MCRPAPHSLRTRHIRPIGSRRSSSRCPCGASAPETAGGGGATTVVMGSPRLRGFIRANGSTSTTVNETPGGAATTAATAAATSAPDMKCGWRCKAPLLPVVEQPVSWPRGPSPSPSRSWSARADARDPHAGAVELHLQRGDESFDRLLGGDVQRHAGPRRTDHLGGDEDQVAAMPLDHPRADRRASARVPTTLTSRCCWKRLTVRGQRVARTHPSRVGDQHLDRADQLLCPLGERRIDSSSARSSATACGDPARRHRSPLRCAHRSRPGGRRAPPDARSRREVCAVASPMPDEAPETTAGRSAGARARGSTHRSVTAVGRWAKPRTLTEWTRRAPSSSSS